MNQKHWMNETAGIMHTPNSVPNHFRVDSGHPHLPHQHQLQQQHQLQHAPQNALQQQQTQTQFQHYQQNLQQQQQQKHQHQQPQQQQHFQHQPQHANYQQVRHLKMTQATTANPHPSYLVQTQNGQPKMTPTSNLTHPNSVAPAPKCSPSIFSQNEDALKQLKNNLRLVLNQQQQQPQQQRGTASIQGSVQALKNIGVNPNTTDTETIGRGTPSIAFQPMAFPHPISANNSVAPATPIKAQSSFTNMDDSSSNSNTSTQWSQFQNAVQPSLSQHLPAQSRNPPSKNNLATKALFGLGDAFQPLPSQATKRDTHPTSKSSSNSLFGNWPEDATEDAVTNDAFMNTLFDAELKMSRQNGKGKKVFITAESNQQHTLHLPSKVGSRGENSVLTPSHAVAWKQTKPCDLAQDKNDLRCHSPRLGVEYFRATGQTSLATSNDTTNKLGKRKAKDGALKKKQKRKSSAKKPKFPVLLKEPPIEEQIMSLPVTALAPSLVANIVTDNPKFRSSIQGFTPDGNDVYQTNVIMDCQDRRFGESYPSENCASRKSQYDTPPTQTFRSLLKLRGHDETYSVDLEGTEYDTVPSALQLASYGTYLVWAILSSDTALVRKLLGCGLSPNPCNQFRDSILGDLVCKKGKFPIYKCFVEEFHADLRVVDGFGRSLLHHCCWAQDLCRPMVEDILHRDPIQIFIKDKQGKTPLEYVRDDMYGKWNVFLEEVADKYWSRDSNLPQFISPAGVRRLPNGDLIDPPGALSPSLAADVASGKITPQAVLATSCSSRKERKIVSRKPTAA